MGRHMALGAAFGREGVPVPGLFAGRARSYRWQSCTQWERPSAANIEHDCQHVSEACKMRLQEYPQSFPVAGTAQQETLVMGTMDL